MKRFDVKAGDTRSPANSRTSTTAKRLPMGIAALLLASGSAIGIVATPAPAHAVVVPNMMLCEPDTGWCYQTNPPVNRSVPHECQWDYKLHNLHSGMWYTGCDYWGSTIH